MRFKPYPKYKPSGLEWLGEVPESWVVAKLKMGFDVCLGKMLQPESKSADDLLANYLRAANIKWEGVDLSDVKEMWFSPAETQQLALIKGDLLVSEGGDVGRSSIWNAELSPCYFQNSVNRIRAKNNHSTRYLYYWMVCIKNGGYIDVLCNKSTIAHFTAEKVGSVEVLFPDYSEQSAITSFLDRETAKIDTLISKQEKLIELLKEKRQAVISHAVTKGLNPKARMKDSGIEWLGAIPEHWQLYPTKRLFRLVAEPAPDNNDEELLSIYTDIGVRPRKSLEAKGNKATTTDGYWIVRKGDIIVNKLLAWMGAIGLSEYDGVTSPAYDILRQAKPLNPKYYDYLFRCGIMLTEFRRYSLGIMDMRLRLYFEELGQIAIPYPPEGEQLMIVDYLQKQSLKIDNLIAKAEQAIELQREHRSALISAAVTGKIDVR